MKALVGFLQMAGLAVVSVSLWTLRVALAARGRKVAASVTAGLEALVFLVAFSSAAADLQAIERLAGYGLGVALGTLTGVLLDDRFSSGQSEVRVVTEERDLGLVHELQGEGWPVTWFYGHGPTGDVTVSFVAVDNARLPQLVKRLRQTAPDAFWTVERLRSARAGKAHPDWQQIGGKRMLRSHRRLQSRHVA